MRQWYSFTDDRYWYFLKKDIREFMMDTDPQSILIGIVLGVIIVFACWLWVYACKGLFFKD